MSTKGLPSIPRLVFDGIEIAVTGDTVRFSGVLSMRSPVDTVTPFLRRIHGAAIEAGVKALNADFTQLRFVNSSAIRVLVDWIEWILQEPESTRYVLAFITKPEHTWQAPTLSALQALGEDSVVIRSIA